MPEDPVDGTSEILDMAFLSPSLSSQDISSSIAHDPMSSDHFPIQISLRKPFKWSTPLSEPRLRHIENVSIDVRNFAYL